MEISHLPDTEFKVMAVKILSKHGRRMDEHSEKFHKELDSVRKNQSELQAIVTEIRKTG